MKRALSAPRPRTELIASFKKMMGFAPYPWDECIQDQLDAGHSQDSAEKICGSIKANNSSSAAPKFATDSGLPPDATAVVDGTATSDKTPVAADTSKADDSDVGKAVTALREAFDEVRKAQAVDPDAATDPNDDAVSALLVKLAPLLDQLQSAQAKDAANDKPVASDTTNTPADTPSAKAPPSPATAKPGNLALDNTTPKINPVDGDGNVDPDAVCANPDFKCGHLASVHGDTDMGENTGVCSTPGCECQSFVVDTGTSSVDNPTAGGDGGGANNAGGDDESPPTADISMSAKFADGVPLTPSASEAPEGNGVTGDDQLDLVPSTPGAMNMGPEFTMVALIEGAQTSDGRFIAPNALSWENPPWALMGKATSTHDPMGMDMDDPAVICGRVDSYERSPGPDGTSLIIGKGFFLANDDGMYFADLVDQMGRLPVSGDVSVGVTSTTLDDDGTGESAMLVTLESGTVEATTILAFGPAFADCYIVLGADLETPAIPQQTPEQAPMTASAQVVHWMSGEDCVPCGWATDSLVASGAPLRPPAAWFTDPKFAEGDGRLKLCEGPTKYGRMVKFMACPPTVTEQGEVFGHIAPKGVCHIGIKGECVIAPHSKTDYALFKRGQHIITADGDPVSVGVLTLDTGHAADRLDAVSTMKHYDNTAVQVAYVNVGEDDFGIWFHGVISASATDAQVQKLRASTPSGDWRDWGGNLELCAALMVNVPGFVPAVKSIAAGGRQLSLVAAGAQEMDALTHPQAIRLDEEITLPARLARKLILADARESLGALEADVAADSRRRIAELAKV